MPAVVILESNKLISVKDEWIRDKGGNKYTIIFHSPNNDDTPDFQLKSKYFFKSNIAACYKARTIKFFDSIESCNQFIDSRPRRIYYSKLKTFQQPEIVEAIDLSSSDDEIVDKHDLGIAESETTNPDLGWDDDDSVDEHDLGIAENEIANLSNVDLPSSSSGTEYQVKFENLNVNDLPEKRRDLFYVMLIANHNSHIVVKKEWVEHPRSEESRFFYSPNLEDLPVFTEQLHYFKDYVVGCYFGRRTKCFGSYENAKKYAERPRRLQQADITMRIVEMHDIEDDDDRTENASSSVEIFEGDLRLKIKQEKIELLENAIKKLTQRVGIEIIEEDDNNNNPPARSRHFDSNKIVNTHAYLLDSEFGEKFYYLNNCKGDRYYLHETLKDDAETVRKLKNMNESYPQNNADYDIEFIYHLAYAIFKDEEIKRFLDERKLICFGKERLRFVKTIYEERVAKNKVRVKAFREHLLKALSDSMVK